MNAINLDKTDILILRYIQTDSTISNLTLAKKVGLSPSACLTRTKRLRQEGIISAYSAVIDATKIGLQVSSYTFVTLSPHNRETANHFVQEVHRIPQILECYNITGNWDYLLKIVSQNISSYRDFVIDKLIAIEGVNHVETLIVLKTEKNTFCLPLEAIPVENYNPTR